MEAAVIRISLLMALLSSYQAKAEGYLEFALVTTSLETAAASSATELAEIKPLLTFYYGQGSLKQVEGFTPILFTI